MNSSALADLEPVVGKLLDRHLDSAREWFPHELVPWERGSRIEPGKPWEPPAGTPISEGVRSAILVNLLTEDNLPYYTVALASAFGTAGAWGDWMRRWTAEEGRHSIVLRDWVTVSGLVDPVVLERARMQQVSGGVAPEPWSAAGTMVYVALQELATRIAHFNTAKALDDAAGYEIMKRVAADENLHFLFYRDLVSAALELDPSDVVREIERVVQGFAMPGTGIGGYRAHAASIADEGIYSVAVFHDQVLGPTLRYWKVEEVTGLDAESSAARDRLLRHAERVGRIGQRLEEQRLERSGARQAGKARSARPGPVGRPVRP
ncbi:MAG: acyl-ACP desaturase [Acidimicrobiales bacterium]